MIHPYRRLALGVLAIALISAATFLLASCGGEPKKNAGDSSGRKVLYWKSPMDPSFIAQKPGKDAMGMDLVPVYEGDPGADLSTITVAGATLQKMGVRYETLRRKRLQRSIRSVATIEYDERSLTVVNMKFDGWIQKLYVNETGQYVRQGEPLFDIYSPELAASAEEYLQAVRNESDVPHMEHLVQSARRRLEQFDLSDGEIEAIRKAGDAPKVLTINAPSSGYVVHKEAFEGTFVKTGSPLFRIADLDTVWVHVDVYEYEVPWLANAKDATMELTYVPGVKFKGVIDYIYPFLDERTRTIKVRLAFPNPKLQLKPGMFATVELESVTPEPVLVVPSEAVIHTGQRNVVFVSYGDGRFEPRDVQLGRSGDGGDYEVLKGLAVGDQVVTSGQFLLDSESRLKEAVAKMLGYSLPAPAMDSTHGHETLPQGSAGDTTQPTTATHGSSHNQ